MAKLPPGETPPTDPNPESRSRLFAAFARRLRYIEITALREAASDHEKAILKLEQAIIRSYDAKYGEAWGARSLKLNDGQIRIILELCSGQAASGESIEQAVEHIHKKIVEFIF